jgi:hypothetical protein
MSEKQTITGTFLDADGNIVQAEGHFVYNGEPVRLRTEGPLAEMMANAEAKLVEAYEASKAQS